MERNDVATSAGQLAGEPRRIGIFLFDLVEEIDAIGSWGRRSRFLPDQRPGLDANTAGARGALRADRPAPAGMTNGDALVPVQKRDHVLGAASPELTLVEYGDFGCPFCLAASRPVRQLVERHDGLSLVWRHLPDPELHPGAELAAELSELAGARGQFWQAHSLLLAGRDHFSLDDLLAVAGQLELDPQEAESALHEHKFRERVLEDVTGAREAGVHATPTFFVGTQRLEGHWSQLAQLVPAALQNQRARQDSNP
jgi:protein-disulfide isomerase